VTLAAKARVGMVFLGADRDVHVFTATQYDEAFDPAPVAELGGEARFRLSSALDGVLAVNLKQIFTARGDTTMVDLTGTDPDEFYPDGAGGTLRELSLSAGISGQF